ncbi:MAG: S8 family peptidase, partial [Acidimicrobiia bacterium]
GYTGAGRAVAVLDTGIDLDHPFFADAIVAEACFSAGGKTDGTTGLSLCPKDALGNERHEVIGAGAADAETTRCREAPECSHGTHVAGIAAGGRPFVTYPGVAPDAGIVAIQVFTRSNCGTEAAPVPCLTGWPTDLLRALEYVRNNAAALNVAAVNLSVESLKEVVVGGVTTYEHYTAVCDNDDDVTKSFKRAIDNLLAAGIPTVTAAGNQGTLNVDGVTFPGCISSAVTVGATGTTRVEEPGKTPQYTHAPLSNRGSQLDLFAPGTVSATPTTPPRGVISALVGSPAPGDPPPAAHYGPMEGTSQAAPHVAGALAVLKQAFPATSGADLVALLRSSGEPVTYRLGGLDFTTPRIDVSAAYVDGGGT